jgi:hypothetical protein
MNTTMKDIIESNRIKKHGRAVGRIYKVFLPLNS